VAALLTWGQTEVALSLAIARASQQNDVLASGSPLSQLVESQSLTLAGEDAFAGLLGEAKGGDTEVRRDVEESCIVGDSADNGNYPAFLFTAVLNDAAEADGIAVKTSLVESFVNDSVEGAIGPASQERVQLR